MPKRVSKALLLLGFALGGVCLGLAIAFQFVTSHIDAQRDRRAGQFQQLGIEQADIVMLGDSITAEGLWSEWLPELAIHNRGIGGDTIADVIARFDDVAALKPRLMFVMIGINDLNKGADSAAVIASYPKLFDLIDKRLPDTRVVIQSVLPVNQDWFGAKPETVLPLNRYLKTEASARGYHWLDLWPLFADESGSLNTALSNDGIHLLARAYGLWVNELRRYLAVDKRVEASKPVLCPEARAQFCTREYRPVCGTRDTGIRCVTTPCDSIEQVTYGNACSACADEAVYSWVAGACQ